MKLHRNAALSLKKRELLVSRVVDENWSLTKAASAAEVSEQTAGKWVRRFAAGVRRDCSTGARLPGESTTAPTNSASR
jgi:transposase